LQEDPCVRASDRRRGRAPCCETAPARPLPLRRRLLGLGLGLLAPAAAPAAEAVAPAPDRAVVRVSPFPRGGDFTLTSASGPVSLTGLRGKVVLLFFGYVTCPDVCPTTLGNLEQAFARLSPEERRQAQVVFVSVDPERDTPAILAAYTSSFDVPAVGLTGTPAAIAEVADRYAAQYHRVDLPGSALGYAVNHSAAVSVIDPLGRLRLLLRHTAPPARFAGEVRRLLGTGHG
jgi:protein SCO1/2